MQFRCPNCRQAIKVVESKPDVPTRLLDDVECPSCHSSFSLSMDSERTVIPEAGMKIGHFEVVSLLGEGAYGSVFKAWDPELKRHVAIKIARASRPNLDYAKAFLREARAAASVSHPNAITVHEIGVYGEGYYIASQLIDGINLAQYLRLHSLSPRDTAVLLIKVLRAIHFFHEQRIIHRDLKPGNILIDSAMQPFVADFGLAISQDPQELTVSKSGNIVGTLNYMSPEQALGERSQLDGRSDVYAVGVILYEMLTGVRPFSATSSQTVLHRILHEDPRLPRTFKREIPVDLESICLKAMEKDVALRYASASEMADDLQRFLDNRPVVARPIGLRRRLGKWVSRNRVLTVALSIAMVAVLVATGVFLNPPESPPFNGVLAVITTDPPASSIEFELYDREFLTRDQSGFQASTASSTPVSLLPGLYRVRAETENGYFHEVWRTVPEPDMAASHDARFPHLTFTWDSDQQAVLPQFRLFRDDDIQDALTRIVGGTFNMGYQAPGDIAGRHQHSVESFYVGINEVTWSRFRKVMDQPLGNPSDQRTYLSVFSAQYGDRSDLPGDQPVTGYPVDVAIVYCELSGTRLPTNSEYEFVATQRGTNAFPTGENAAVASVSEWKILASTEQTPDTSPEGLRNLYFSVAEYTENIPVAYFVLFPELIPQVKEPAIPASLRSMFAGRREVRGVPAAWLSDTDKDESLNPRKRLSVPQMSQGDSIAAQTFRHVGWRVYRTARR